ncbi:MAG: hypothetical protein JXX29_03075 [Deltaproteobacteria bacterium]|nr:hypothetical protein [Deltaproteobacteria bacterium]MBN2670625.1 hypothetical protein [Deltaproteobacteria bacterium]
MEAKKNQMDRRQERNQKRTPALEIRIHWNGELRDVVQVAFDGKQAACFRVGEAFRCDFPMVSKWLSGMSEVTLVRQDASDQATVNIPKGACATLFGPQPDDARILEPQQWRLKMDERMDLVLGPLKFQVQWTEPEAPPCNRSLVSKTLPLVILAALVLHLFFFRTIFDFWAK